LGLEGTLGLAGWQWLFLLEGAPAVALSVAVWFWLPDGSAPGLAREVPERPPVVRAIANVPVMALGAMNFLVLGVIYAVTFSAPLLIRGATHWSDGRIGSVVACGGVLGAVAMLVAGWLSDRGRDRLMSVAIPLLGGAAALAVLAFVRTPAGLVGGYLAFFAMAYAVLGVFWATLDRLLPASFAPVAIAAINSIGMIGSFLAPILWGRARDLTGSWDLGLKILPLGYLLAAGIVLALRHWSRARGATADYLASAA
jgi:ACS family tartrate transporter-like MFS transporter